MAKIRDKLSPAAAKAIRELRKRGWLFKDIAALFGVKPVTVQRIVHGYTWRKEDTNAPAA